MRRWLNAAPSIRPGRTSTESDATGATPTGALVFLGLGAAVVAAAFAEAFVMPQTQPRQEPAAAALVSTVPWWELSRVLGPLVPESGRTVTMAVATLQIVTFIVYAAGIRLAWRRPVSRAAIPIVVGTTVLAWSLTASALPTLDTDVFSYIAQGRVASVHAANPETTPPAAFPDDPLTRFVSPEYAGIVGDNKLPLWSDITAAVASAAGSSPAAALLDYRLLFLVANLAVLRLIAFSLRRLAPDLLLAGLVVYGWSPIVVQEAQSKVDTVMALLVVLGIALLIIGRRRLAVASLVGSVLVKLISLPLLVVRLGGEFRRREWRGLAADAGVGLVVVAAVYLPFWAGPNEIGRQIALLGSSGSVVPAVLRPLATVVFVVATLWMIKLDDGSAARLVRSGTILMLVFGALLTAPGLSWYLLTMIALAAICADGRLVAIAVAISFVSFAFDRVQRFELTAPIAVSRGATYVGLAALAVALAWWLNRTRLNTRTR